MTLIIASAISVKSIDWHAFMRIYANVCILDSRAQNVFIHAMRKSLPLLRAIPLFLSIFYLLASPLLFLHFPLFSLFLSFISSYLLFPSSFSFCFSSPFLIFWTFTKTRMFAYLHYIRTKIYKRRLPYAFIYVTVSTFIVLLNDAFNVKQAQFRILLYIKIASLINSEYNNKCTYILPYLHLLI